MKIVRPTHINLSNPGQNGNLAWLPREAALAFPQDLIQKIYAEKRQGTGKYKDDSFLVKPEFLRIPPSLLKPALFMLR